MDLASPAVSGTSVYANGLNKFVLLLNFMYRCDGGVLVRKSCVRQTEFGIKM